MALTTTLLSLECSGPTYFPVCDRAASYWNQLEELSRGNAIFIPEPRAAGKTATRVLKT